MNMQSEKISVRTSRQDEFIDITDKVQRIVDKHKIEHGICFVFVPHTTAGITINENADPSVTKDILRHTKEMVPEKKEYLHLEGNADAHIKGSLFGSSLTIFISNGKLFLGRWQGVYFCEFDGPRRRTVYIKVVREHT